MSALVLSLMLAARPTVAVEVDPDLAADANAPMHAQMVQRRAWLVRRLLEEGYDVAASRAGAHGVVHLRSVDEGLVVEVEGQARRSYAVEPGPEAVMRLEVLHRALVGAEQACDRTRSIAAPEPGLTVHFVTVSPDDASLLEAVATAAQRQGVTLSAQPAPDDTLACIERRGSLAQIGLGPAVGGCGPPLLVLELGDGSAARLQRAADDLLAVTGPSPPDATPLDVRALGGPSPVEPGPLPVDVQPEADLVAMHGPPRAEARVGASAGVASRGRWVDPLVQAGWRMGKIRGIGGRLSVSLIPSNGRAQPAGDGAGAGAGDGAGDGAGAGAGDGDGAGAGGSSPRVLDVRLVVGPDWELGAGRRGHVVLAALVGADLHVTGVGDETAGDMAFAAELPVTYALTLRGHTRLDFIVDPGITSVAWTHREAVWRTGAVVWERPVWRVGVALGLTHGWRIE